MDYNLLVKSQLSQLHCGFDYNLLVKSQPSHNHTVDYNLLVKSQLTRTQLNVMPKWYIFSRDCQESGVNKTFEVHRVGPNPVTTTLQKCAAGTRRARI